MKTMNRMPAVGLTKEVLCSLICLLVNGHESQQKLQLASSPGGRIALHLICATRDCRFAWHWRGMTRELRVA
jgi:hypothetical protein